MTHPTHPAEGKPLPLHLKIVAEYPANVELATFQGRTAIRFRDPLSRISQQPEEFGHSIAAVIAAQASVSTGSLNERVLLVPEERRFLYVCDIPEGLSEAKNVIQTVISELCEASATAGSDVVPAQLNPAAFKELDDVKNTLLRKHGGDTIPEFTASLGDEEVYRARGTYRPKPNKTDLEETEEPFEGIIAGFKGPPREAYVTLMKDGSLKERQRKAHWVDDATGDKIASLATLPSRTNEIRVAGFFRVTRDAKGNPLYEIKEISQK